MAKKIDPELKKLGEYLKLEKESFFVIQRIKGRILGK